jgi:hypothetical protein
LSVSLIIVHFFITSAVRPASIITSFNPFFATL